MLMENASGAQFENYTPPGIPVNEESRLKELLSLKLLDTAPSPGLDSVTRAATQLFGTQISLLTLVDEHRQWFKSRQGLNVAQTPREQSFCGHAIIHPDEAFIVEDTHLDTRFAKNPLVTGNPFIRSYAGMPVRGPGGSALGTLCIIDPKPRKFSEHDIRLLEGLVRWAEMEILLEVTGFDTPRDLFGIAAVDDPSKINRARFWNLASDMLCIANTDGFFLDVNGQFTKVLGHSREALLKESFMYWIHPDDVEPTILEVDKLKSGIPTVAFRNRYRTKDNSYCWLDWNATPVDGLLYATARDVTLQIEMEELKRRQKIQLEAKNKILTEFGNLVAHDLREPLRSASTQLDRVQEANQDVDLEKVRKSLTRMSEMLEGFRDVARNQSDSDQVLTDLNEVMQDSINGLQAAIEESGADIEVAGLPTIRGSPAQLHSLFQNLLHNAIKYGGEPPKIRVWKRNAEQGVEIIVHDNGGGIPESFRERIFDPFQRGELHGQPGGLGMGLFAAQVIASHHGGSIRIEDGYPHGTDFVVLLEDT